jgi:hypothetical protein
MNMSDKVAELVLEFKRKYGSGSAALRALGVTPRLAAAFDEAPPETVSAFLRRKGMSEADIAEFRRRCDEGEHAEDGDEAVGEQVSKIHQFVRDRMQGDDVGTFETMMEELLRCAMGDAAQDMLPTAVANGSRFPKSRMELEHRQAMDEDRAQRSAQHRHTQACDITIGADSAYGLAVDGVRFPGERKKPRSGAEKLPDTSHIKVGAI